MLLAQEKAAGGRTAWGPIVALVVALAGCGEGEAVPPFADWPLITREVAALHERDKSATNIVLVSVDTLRADHVGAYGYGPPTTPRIDAFSSESVVFESTIAQAPSTLPSHASILTSLLPEQHGAFFARRTPLAPEKLSVVEVLSEAGLATAAFTGGGQMATEFGLSQGFDSYTIGTPRFADTVALGLDWIDDTSADRFFLFLHTYETHHPYDPEPQDLALFDGDYDGPLPDKILGAKHLKQINGLSEPPLEIDAGDLAHIVATYDAEIHSVDAAFGRLLEGLRERGLYDDTLIVFTSDHGEEFDEHGWVGWHAHSLYDELLRVPLIVKFPGGAFAGRRVVSQVRSLDIAPTMLDVLGIKAPEVFEGLTLLNRSASQLDRARFAVSQLDRAAGRTPIASIRTADWKLYGKQLYDLAADPLEQIDLHRQERDVAENLDNLRAWLLDEPPLADTNTVELSTDTLEALSELGYL